MRKSIFICLGLVLGCIFCPSLLAQRNYRVITLDSTASDPSDSYEFILPPHSNIRLKVERSEPKNRFKFYNLHLKGLSKDYTLNLQSLENVKGWNGRHDYFDENSKKEIAKKIREANVSKNGCDCSIAKGTDYKAAFLLSHGSELFIQIRYENLVKNKIKENFQTLIIELLRDIARLEGNFACVCPESVKLPSGFSHQLVKKLKEWVPLPVDLPQPGTSLTEVDDQSNFILLDDDLVLKVDEEKKRTISSGNSSKFIYDWMGVSIHSFARSRDGKVVENAFGLFNNGLPDNLLVVDKNIFKLSSFADVQSSETLKDRYFIGLYHPPLKRNNSASSPGAYIPDDDANPVKGNPFLLHFLSPQIASLNFCEAFENDTNYTKSIFFDRGSIEPLIKILINGKHSLQGIKQHPLDIKNVPAKYLLWRKYGSVYRKVKGNKNATYLLPYDHLNYKL